MWPHLLSVISVLLKVMEQIIIRGNTILTCSTQGDTEYSRLFGTGIPKYRGVNFPMTPEMKVTGARPGSRIAYRSSICN